MTTIEKKLEKANKKREGLLRAKADLVESDAERVRQERHDELESLLERSKQKVERASALRARLDELLRETDRVASQTIFPLWCVLELAVNDSKFTLEQFTEEHNLPKPNYHQMETLRQAAPWIPLPLVESVNPKTGEVTTSTHPAYLQFGPAFIAAWNKTTDKEKHCVKEAE